MKHRLLRPEHRSMVRLAVDIGVSAACRTDALKRALFAAEVEGHIRRESAESSTFSPDPGATPDKGNSTIGAGEAQLVIISALTTHVLPLHCVTLMFVTLHIVTQRVTWHVHQNPD